MSPGELEFIVCPAGAGRVDSSAAISRSKRVRVMPNPSPRLRLFAWCQPVTRLLETVEGALSRVLRGVSPSAVMSVCSQDRAKIVSVPHVFQKAHRVGFETLRSEALGGSAR